MKMKIIRKEKNLILKFLLVSLLLLFFIDLKIIKSETELEAASAAFTF